MKVNSKLQVLLDSGEIHINAATDEPFQASFTDLSATSTITWTEHKFTLKALWSSRDPLPVYEFQVTIKLSETAGISTGFHLRIQRQPNHSYSEHLGKVWETAYERADIFIRSFANVQKTLKPFEFPWSYLDVDVDPFFNLDVDEATDEATDEASDQASDQATDEAPATPDHSLVADANTFFSWFDKPDPMPYQHGENPPYPYQEPKPPRIEVYFETPILSYALLAATFTDRDCYEACLTPLTKLAHSQGYIITESHEVTDY